MWLMAEALLPQWLQRYPEVSQARETLRAPHIVPPLPAAPPRARSFTAVRRLTTIRSGL